MNIDFSVIIDLITSTEIQEKLFPIKIGFLVLAGFFLAFIIFALNKTHYLQWLFFQDAVEFLTRRPFGAKRITRVWNKIKQRLDSGMESEYKLSVIEADNMLDSSLKRMGYAGKTLEEKLNKLTSATLPNIEDLYRAHKIRNNIVHDPDFRLTTDEARKTMDVYEQAFKDLQILT